MQIQNRWFIANLMLVVFRIMPAKKSKHALAFLSVDVTRFAIDLAFAQHQHIRFYQFTFKRSGLSHESFYELRMVLAKHAWYDVPFGRKFHQCEIILLHW